MLWDAIEGEPLKKPVDFRSQLTLYEKIVLIYRTHHSLSLKGGEGG